MLVQEDVMIFWYEVEEIIWIDTFFLLEVLLLFRLSLYIYDAFFLWLLIIIIMVTVVLFSNSIIRMIHDHYYYDYMYIPGDDHWDFSSIWYLHQKLRILEQLRSHVPLRSLLLLMMRHLLPRLAQLSECGAPKQTSHRVGEKVTRQSEHF